MKKMLLVMPMLALLLTACPTEPIRGDLPPVEDRKMDSTKITPIDTQDGKVTGLPDELLNPKSPLSVRTIYFDLDKYEIKDEFKDLVTAHANFLNKNRAFKMRIQGHTDERGTPEYNLSLGQKRAEALKRMLILLGAKEEQVEAVSYGKQQPAVEGHTEEAWAKNRRAHMLYKGPTGTGEFDK